MEKQTQVDINKMSVEELKVLAYDMSRGLSNLMQQVEGQKQAIATVNNRIVELENPKAETKPKVKAKSVKPEVAALAKQVPGSKSQAKAKKK